MTGIICCASPSLWAILQKALDGKLHWRHHIKALQVYVSGPTARDTGGTRTWPELEEGRDGHDLEKGSAAEIDTDGDEGQPIQRAITSSEGIFPPVGDEVNKAAVTLVDFFPSCENELTLSRGQLVWIHDKHGQGWLLAENLLTHEAGLVPGESVRLLSSIPAGMRCEN